MFVQCPYCQESHDILALEPSFGRPDAFLELNRRDDVQVRDSKDSCAVRSADDSWRRYFLRVLVPFTVLSVEKPVSWGAWVEITEEQHSRVEELWDSPKQSSGPPFTGRFANALHGYQDTLDITGLVSLTDPSNIPTFHMIAPGDNQFVREQQSLVSPQRVAEWLVPIYHGNSLREQGAQENESPVTAAGKRWWQFWL